MNEEDISYHILHETDFPDYFHNKNHPEDFKPMSSPYTELIYHRRAYHNRIFVRIGVKISAGTYIPLTFIS